MNFTSQDIAIIERALRAAMKSEEDDHRNEDFREVLLKLRDSAKHAIHPHSYEGEKQAPDGIRFDYDDSSDLL
jgi:hypothetical protein